MWCVDAIADGEQIALRDHANELTARASFAQLTGHFVNSDTAETTVRLIHNGELVAENTVTADGQVFA